MVEQEIRGLIIHQLRERLQRMGLNEHDLTDDLDLLHSGVLDSLGLVVLLSDLEIRTGTTIDLDQALARKGATTVSGIVRLFS